MISVTEQKPFEEIIQYLDRYQSVYLIGCGTCTTIQHTGGKAEVLALKDKLEATGKKVTGWMVIPTACDELARYALEESEREVGAADCILVTACSFGVQNVNQYLDKSIFPFVNTLFIGKETTLPGNYAEVCVQCGECVLAWTGGICPIITCNKGLLNGPCGGTNQGKCEVDPNKDCAWTLIYQRLEQLGRLDLFETEQPPKNWGAVLRPGKVTIE